MKTGIRAFFPSCHMVWVMVAAVTQIVVPEVKAADPLDRVTAYTLYLDPVEGLPLPGYFPMGMRPGMPDLTTHAGFNLTQVSSTHRWITGFRGPNRTGPFTPPPPPDPHGKLQFALGRAGSTMSRNPRSWPLETVAFGHLHAAVDYNYHDRQPLLGDPYPDTPQSYRNGLRLTTPGAIAYLQAYAREHVQAWHSSSAIHFWGLDNEWERFRDYSEDAREAFAEWLATAYHGDIAGLREAWGTSPRDFREAAGLAKERVLAVDRFTDRRRVERLSRGGLDWFVAYPDYAGLTVAEDSGLAAPALVVTRRAGNNAEMGQVVAHFDPVTLEQAGESLELNFRFRVRLIHRDNDGNRFAFGLYQTRDQDGRVLPRTTADGVIVSDHYRGYGYQINFDRRPDKGKARGPYLESGGVDRLAGAIRAGGGADSDLISWDQRNWRQPLWIGDDSPWFFSLTLTLLDPGEGRSPERIRIRTELRSNPGTEDERTVFHVTETPAGTPPFTSFDTIAFGLTHSPIDYALTDVNIVHRYQAAAAGVGYGRLPHRDEYRRYPAVFLDLWTFFTETFVHSEAGRARAMHKTDPRRRGVVNKSTQQSIEMPRANRHRTTLDHGLMADLFRPYSGGIYGFNAYGSGDRQTYETNFIYNCIRPLDRAPGYGVMLPENNNHGGPGHAWAATNWRLLANGLKAVNFFCTGWLGAEGDYRSFGHVDALTGKPRDKMHYAARWAHSLHRSERFWTESRPAEGLPRIAMLMPRRDLLLADPTPRSSSFWAYPRNHRWLVFRWLREQGYWVDVIPYQKLDDGYLAAYEALFLVGAEHLTEIESKVIDRFVAAGGRLLADAGAGRFDEHHRLRNWLDHLLGLRILDHDMDDRPRLVVGSDRLTAYSRSQFALVDAEVVVRCLTGKPLVTLRDHGKGRVLYLGTELGSLETEVAPTLVDAWLPEGPTADAGEYDRHDGELLIGHWLGRLLRQLGLEPAYSHADSGESGFLTLRVESPMIDDRGNIGLVLATRAGPQDEVVAKTGTIRIRLPEKTASRGFWGPAEHAGLEPIELRPTGEGWWMLDLPPVESAGILYLFRESAPLLGIARIDGVGRSIDGQTAQVRAGELFFVKLQLTNPSATALAAGELRLLARRGWRVEPAVIPTGKLSPGDWSEHVFTVAMEAEALLSGPGWLSPLVARWSDGESDRAICSTNVEVVGE